MCNYKVAARTGFLKPQRCDERENWWTVNTGQPHTKRSKAAFKNNSQNIFLSIYNFPCMHTVSFSPYCRQRVRLEWVLHHVLNFLTQRKSKIESPFICKIRSYSFHCQQSRGMFLKTHFKIMEKNLFCFRDMKAVSVMAPSILWGTSRMQHCTHFQSYHIIR